MASIEKKVEDCISPVINNLGYEVYDVEYVKEGKNYFLRIYIDSTNGIDLEDCEKVSNSINELLDKEDYIKEQYFLEVSSPGIEKVLKKDKHLNDNIGNLVEVKLFSPLSGKKNIVGILDEFFTDSISIKDENNQIQIDRKNIALIKTVYNWN